MSENKQRLKTKIGAAVVLGLAFVALVCLLYFKICPEQCSSELCKMIRTNPPWIFLSAIAAAPSAILIWYWRDMHKREDIKNAREGLFIDRFSKAIGHFGDNKVHVILGGLYSLEKIAINSEHEHWSIQEIISSYIRFFTDDVNSSKAENIDGLGITVQAAISVICRRKWLDQEKRRKVRINLRDSNLYQKDMRNGNLDDAILLGSSLHEADLRAAHLKKANLRKAILIGAKLQKSDLRGADLRNANLSGSFLQDADLDGCEWKNQKNESVIILKNAKYNSTTVLPNGLDPEAHEMIKVEKEQVS